MSVPATALETARRPFAVAKIGALFQRLFAPKARHEAAPDLLTGKPRSVADLLEFGYSVSGADHRYPHMPA